MELLSWVVVPLFVMVAGWILFVEVRHTLQDDEFCENMANTFRAMGSSLAQTAKLFADFADMITFIIFLVVKGWEEKVGEHERKKMMECGQPHQHHLVGGLKC